MKSREVKIGDRVIGNGNPILIQSMTNTKTSNLEETIEQIKRLEEAGCDIIRVAVSDEESALNIKEIKKHINIPLVVDIQFSPELALASIENGADKLRINPGNIGGLEATKKIIEAAKEKNIPIRIGVNTGSIEKDLLEKYGGPKPEALVESAERYLKFFEDNDFYNTVVSLKASNVKDMIAANKLFAERNNYPLHLGLTEAGIGKRAIIKSSIALGALLDEGVGDTIRVSLTGDPVEEVEVARDILNSLDLETSIYRPQLISCPTCDRTNIDLEKIARSVEDKLLEKNKKIKVAVMGCVVNGPGEAKEADIGIAGGNGSAVLFKKGKVVKTIKEDDITRVLLEEIDKL